MAPHSSTLAWKIPWTEKPSRLQSVGSLRVGHNWATSLSLFTFMHWRRKWQPTPVFLPGESQGQRSLLGCRLWGFAQSRTWLKQLSNSIVFIFPDSSVGKESACNAGDPELIPGWGRSTGECIGYPVQYSWASLVVQLVKNTPAMQETWVWSLGWEDPLERESLSSVQSLSRDTLWHHGL